MVQQFLPEAISLLAAIQEETVLSHTGGAKVIGHRTDAQDQIVVANAVTPDNLSAVLVENWRDHDLTCLPIDCLKAAEKEAVSPPMPVTAIADLIQVRIERSGCDLVQERFPDVGLASLDEDHVESLPTQLGTKPPHKLEAAGPTSDNNDLGLHICASPAS
jgi:hypothetical protein